MNARLSLDEMREAAIRDLIPAHAAAIRMDVEIGLSPLPLIADGVTDLLGDSGLANQLTWLSAVAPSAAGHLMGWLTAHVIAEQAEVEALKDVAQMERNRQESHDEARIESAVYEQNMRLHGWGGMS